MKYLLFGGLLFLGGVLLFSSGSASALALSPKGKKILLLGDSLSVKPEGTLGQQLAKLLRGAGAEVTVNALGGRSANSFIAGSKGLKEPKKGEEQLQEAIDQGVDTAVILLVTNDLAGLAKESSLKTTKKNFQKIVKKLRDAGVTVYGIGAIHYKERPEFHPFEERLNEALLDVYGADFFVNAGPLTEGYKMHAQGKSAANFARRLFLALTGAK